MSEGEEWPSTVEQPPNKRSAPHRRPVAVRNEAERLRVGGSQ